MILKIKLKNFNSKARKCTENYVNKLYAITAGQGFSSRRACIAQNNIDRLNQVNSILSEILQSIERDNILPEDDDNLLGGQQPLPPLDLDKPNLDLFENTKNYHYSRLYRPLLVYGRRCQYKARSYSRFAECIVWLESGYGMVRKDRN